MTTHRIESDSMGDVKIPIEANYGAQTQRAINNFKISNRPLPEQFIRALITLKIATANANFKLDRLTPSEHRPIVNAAEQLLNDQSLLTHFPVDVFQTGSGTSSNMNANEVIANLANKNSEQIASIHPNDHVNLGQSSNDVIPTAIHLSATLALRGQLLPALQEVIASIKTRADELKSVTKTGRTHLMDAMPVRMDQSLNGWIAQLSASVRAIEHCLPRISELAIGGTAVGTGVNGHADFAAIVCSELTSTFAVPFHPAANHFALQSSQDTAVAVSGVLKTLAVTVMKISNDLRWMNSGPLAGLGEIQLPELQPGSSIMPGKVNPVIPEATAMVCAQVIGNDTTITVAGQSGNFELNVMLPVIADNLLSSIELMSNALVTLRKSAIDGFTVNQTNIDAALHRNPILVTALNPIIGYSRAAEIAKTAYKSGEPIIDVAERMTELSRQKLEEALNPLKLTQGA